MYFSLYISTYICITMGCLNECVRNQFMTILYFIAKWSPQSIIKRFLFNNYFLDSLSFIIYIYKCNILVRYSSVHSTQHQVPIMNKLLIDPLINSIYLVSKPIFLEINTITKQQFVIIYQRCVINLQSTLW